MTPTDPVQVAWDWVAHLRAGGTTPWRDYRDGHRATSGGPGPAGGGRLPGAAQLELVRRLAERAADLPAPGPTGLPGLLELALARSGPGRGLPEIPLDLTGAGAIGPGAGTPTGVGAPPTDPADVPVGELVRVGVGLLVDELLTQGPGAPPPTPAEPRPTRRRILGRSFWLAGAPTTTASVRAELAGSGHVPGGRSPEVLLYAEPLDHLLGQAWSGRVQRGAPVPWKQFVDRWSRRDALPPSADLPALAASWAARVGSGRVHVLVGPDPLRDTLDLLRLRHRPGRSAARGGQAEQARPAAVGAAAVDLLRRVNAVLDVRLAAVEHTEVRARLLGALPRATEPAGSPGLAVPAAHRQWADECAERVVEALRDGGYPVHGDLDRVAARPGGPLHPRRPEVLNLLLDTVLRVGGARDEATTREARAR